MSREGTSRRVPILLAALVAAATFAVHVSAATAAAPGVVGDLTWGASAADQERSAAQVGASGARWIRLTAQWKNVEPAVPGVYDAWWLAHLDRGVQLARAAGLSIVMTVYDAPAWSSGATSRTTPRDVQDYARFVGFLATRYHRQVQAYEIWNEPNTARFWTDPDAAAYTRLLQASYGAVKAADANARVVFGGLSTSDYAFVEAAYSAGARGAFDVMAVHPYTYCGNTGPDDVRRTSAGRISRDSFVAYREVYASMAARGDAKPIWITEFGWNTSTATCTPSADAWQGGVSEQTQADYLRRAYELFAQDPYVDVAFAYNFRNNYWQNDADTPEARYGLVRTDFSPKPAFLAFQSIALGAAPTPEPAPAPAAAPEPAPVPAPAPAEPALSVIAIVPAAGAIVTARTLDIVARAVADRGVARVEFMIDGRAIGADSSAPYELRYGQWKKHAAGTYTITAVVVDADGRTAGLASAVVKAPTLAPQHHAPQRRRPQQAT